MSCSPKIVFKKNNTLHIHVSLLQNTICAAALVFHCLMSGVNDHRYTPLLTWFF